MLGNKKSKIRFFIFLTGLFLFLNSCGLDTFVVVEPPYSIGVGPNVDTEDYSYKFFQFDTNCDLSGYPDDFVFLGTNVYYKIYTTPAASALRRSCWFLPPGILSGIAEGFRRSTPAPFPARQKDTHRPPHDRSFLQSDHGPSSWP